MYYTISFILKDIDGNWGEWSEFSACNAACGDGKKQRSRNCDNPQQEGDGDDCDGYATDIVDCNEGACTEGNNFLTLVCFKQSLKRYSSKVGPICSPNFLAPKQNIALHLFYLVSYTTYLFDMIGKLLNPGCCCWSIRICNIWCGNKIRFNLCIYSYEWQLGTLE